MHEPKQQQHFSETKNDFLWRRHQEPAAEYGSSGTEPRYRELYDEPAYSEPKYEEHKQPHYPEPQQPHYPEPQQPRFPEPQQPHYPEPQQPKRSERYQDAQKYPEEYPLTSDYSDKVPEVERPSHKVSTVIY